MATFFLFVTLFAFIGLVVGLVSPALISRLVKRTLNRKQVGLIFGGLFVFSFIVTGVLAPTPPAQQRAQEGAPNVGVGKIVSSTVQEAPVAKIEPSGSLDKVSDPGVSPTAPPRALGRDATSTARLFLVTHVVDGDTFDVDMDGKKERIRMIGVDTPETVDPRKPVQCFGKAASAKMTELIAGKQVALETDPTQGELDKYQRLLRYVFLPSGQDVGLSLIQGGYAHEYTYRLPYKYQQAYKAAELAARTGQMGLWAPDACSGSTTALTSSVATSTPSVPSSSVVTVPTTVSADGPAVKKSTTGICHQKGSTYYDKTKEFSPYVSLQACLDSGGRLPKG